MRASCLMLMGGLAAAALVTVPAFADPCTAIPDRGPAPSWLRKGAVFSGPVVYVGDGDSLCVEVGRRVIELGPKGASWVEVRLADFYAPELHDAGGASAKADLERLAKGRRVTCVADHRSYDRMVAKCTLNGVSLGDRLRAGGDPQGGRGWSATRR